MMFAFIVKIFVAFNKRLERLRDEPSSRLRQGDVDVADGVIVEEKKTLRSLIGNAFRNEIIHLSL